MRLIFKITLTIAFTQSAWAIGTQFLAVPHTASDLSLGGQAGLAVESPANPATLVFSGSGMDLGISHGSWLAGVTQSAVNVNTALFDGKAAFGIRYSGLDDLELRVERPMDEPLSEYGANGIALDAGWARSFGATKVGIRMHLVRIRLYTESSSGLGFDLGYHRQLAKHFSVGAAVLNLGTMNEFENEKPRLPVRFLAGAGYHFDNPQAPTDLGITAEYQAITESMAYYFSSRSSWKMLTLQIGTRIADNVVAATGGFGISLGRYQINYGIQFGSQQLGMPQLFDISVQLP